MVLSISVNNQFSVEALESSMKVFYAACENTASILLAAIPLLPGSDLSSVNNRHRRSGADAYVKQDGAKLNDLICVSGDLGATFLRLFSNGRKRSSRNRFTTRPGEPGLYCWPLAEAKRGKDVIEYFAEHGIVPTSHCQMDVSDGLSSDILHLQTKAMWVVYCMKTNYPSMKESKDFAYKLELDPTACALSGGGGL